MNNLDGLLHSTFWNKLKELTDWLRSHSDAYKLLDRIEDDSKEEKKNKSIVFSVNATNKETVLRKIEEIVVNILQDLSNGSLPKLVLNKRGSFENTKFTEGKGVEMLTDVTNHEISLENPNSLRKFAVMMSCLSICYKLLQKGTHSTKRDIFYSNVGFFQNQHTVDEAISDISCMLGVPRHSLNVLSSSKGLICGDLKFKDVDGNVLKCCVNEGIQVPSSIEKLHDFQSNARYILVIEKEATYQRLMEYNLSEKLGPCILLTGKGFPDINTRMLLHKLWEELHVPILALVDADPHGIEIMCVYKYGSKSLSHEASYLTCPAMKWVGIHPADIHKMNIKDDILIPLTESDVKKAKEIIIRPYIVNNPELFEQVETLLKIGKKAEIECLDSLSRSFMTDIYLPHKIRTGDWL